MARPRPQKLIYPHPSRGSVTVERISPQNISRWLARRIVDLLHDAYWQEFEAPDLASHPTAVPLRLGTVGEHFNIYNEEALAKRADRMQADMNEKGSQYWISGGPDPRTGAYALRALAKVSPSHATPWQKIGLVAPNCYIDQVAARPLYEDDGQPRRQRDGSMVLHAALVGSGFSPRRQVVADIHRSGRGSGRGFFAVAGLVPQGGYAEPFVLNEDTLGQAALSNERNGGQTVGETIAALEAHTPWLAHAQPEY